MSGNLLSLISLRIPTNAHDKSNSINCRTFLFVYFLCANLYYFIYVCRKNVSAVLLVCLFVCFFSEFQTFIHLKFPQLFNSYPDQHISQSYRQWDIVLLLAIIAVRPIVCIGSIGLSFSIFPCVHCALHSTHRTTSTYTLAVLVVLSSYSYWCCCCCYRQTHTQSVR